VFRHVGFFVLQGDIFMSRYLISSAMLVFIAGCAIRGGGGESISEAPAQLVIEDAKASQFAYEDEMVQFAIPSAQYAHIENQSIHPRTRSTTAEDDSRLVNEATMLNLTGIVLGEAALRSAGRPEVQKLGQQMIDGHTQAQSELGALSARRGLKIPIELDPMHLSMVRGLSRLTGPNFDQRFIQVVIREYEKVIARFDAHVEGGYDPELRAFSARCIPALQQHQRLAMNIQPTLELAAK
jgi:putative membrane protein